MIAFDVEYAVEGRYLEATAGLPIFPGMLVKVAEGGVAYPHGVKDGAASHIFAVENKICGTDITVPYDIGDTVFLRYGAPGDVFIGIFESADIEPGMWVASNGDGRFCRASSGTLTDGSIVGTVLFKKETPAILPHLMYEYYAVNDDDLNWVFAQSYNSYCISSLSEFSFDNLAAIEIL